MLRPAAPLLLLTCTPAIDNEAIKISKMMATNFFFPIQVDFFDVTAKKSGHARGVKQRRSLLPTQTAHTCCLQDSDISAYETQVRASQYLTRIR